MTWTPTREDDVALARDVLGCNVLPATGWDPYDRCGCDSPEHGVTTAAYSLVKAYATAPTGNDMLALIEGMAAKGWACNLEVCMNGCGVTFWRPQPLNATGIEQVFAEADSLPAAVAEAALRATGNWREG